MTKDDFQARFGDDPRRDDLTLLNPKQDDPTEQVTADPLFCNRASEVPCLQCYGNLLVSYEHREYLPSTAVTICKTSLMIRTDRLALCLSDVFHSDVVWL